MLTIVCLAESFGLGKAWLMAVVVQGDSGLDTAELA